MLSPAEEAAKTLYRKGIIDGMEVVLSQLLGRRTAGEAYLGRLNLEAAEWAMEKLTGIHELKRKGVA